MKNVTTIFILIVLIYAQMQVVELLKLPNLFHHFIDHKIQDNQLSFIDFLEIHYGHNDVNDSNDVSDNDLPFKKWEIPDFSIAIPSQIIYVQLNTKNYGVLRLKSVFSSMFISNNLHAKIWQPPKF